MTNENKPTRPVTDDSYLSRLVHKGKSDEFIAAKMGMTVEEVRKRKAALAQLATVREENGLVELRGVSQVLGEQFQLLGQSLGIFTAALSNTYEPSELRRIIQACPRGSDLAVWLMSQTIVLRPFSMPSPGKLAEEMTRQDSPSKK